jgi:hypothetical protein
MKKHGISAVFCSDSIIDDLVYLTAAAGITVVSLSTSFLSFFSIITFFPSQFSFIFLVFFFSYCHYSEPSDSALHTVTQPAPLCRIGGTALETISYSIFSMIISIYAASSKFQVLKN